MADVVWDVEAVADHHLDIVITELLEPGARRIGQCAEALDGQNLGCKAGQDGGLVARTSPDLQHAVTLLQRQLFGHVGHHEGLADGLPAGDGQRTVTIGVGTIGLGDKGLARHVLHGAQHALVADAPPPQRELKHHLFRGAVLGSHLGLVRAICRTAGRAMWCNDAPRI